MRLEIPTMKSQGAAKNAANNEAQSVAPAQTAAVSAPALDLSRVKIEPLFEDMVDFETFSRSDFRAVKIEACEAVPKSKKLLKFTLNDGTDRKRTILSGIHEYTALISIPSESMPIIFLGGRFVMAIAVFPTSSSGS